MYEDKIMEASELLANSQLYLCLPSESSATLHITSVHCILHRSAGLDGPREANFGECFIRETGRS